MKESRGRSGEIGAASDFLKIETVMNFWILGQRAPFYKKIPLAYAEAGFLFQLGYLRFILS